VLKEFAEYIVGLGKDKIVEVNGKAFSTGPLVKIPKFTPTPLDFNTLSGLVGYIKATGETNQAFVAVRSPKSVSLLSGLDETDLSRHCYVNALLSYKQFEFGAMRFMPQEDFIIALQTMFSVTPDLLELQDLVSSVKEESTDSSRDDGVSQVVSVKAGVLLKTERVVRNPWVLRPHRTFLDVPQPESKFILRVRRDHGISMMLFETDGGQWEMDATKSLVEFLKAETGLTVIG
jgi:hypothetical protein